MLGQHLLNCPSYQHPSIKCPSNERLSNMNIPDLTFLHTYYWIPTAKSLKYITYISISKLNQALLYFDLNTFTIDWMSFP